MKIALGSDHGGFELKNIIANHLSTLENTEVLDLGTYSKESVDYPDFGKLVAEAVVDKKADKGIVFCGTGIGISIAANKVKGARCALCTEPFAARMSIEHNNANILALGGRVLGKDLAIEIVNTWLKAEFQGGRHQKRIDKISEIE